MAKKKKAPAKKSKAKQAGRSKIVNSKPVLLTGGNPQIAKADGNQPVQQFIAAMPDWKHAVGKRLDELIVARVPQVRKAVRWNTPFYGIEGKGWFVAFNCTKRYVKVTFFKGSALKPNPPVESKSQDVKYFHIFENDEWDDEQFSTWITQASSIKGEMLF